MAPGEANGLQPSRSSTAPVQESGVSGTVVVTGRGLDGPGTTAAFVKAVVKHGCHVLDMAQFLLEGSLVFTFVFELSGQQSMRVMIDLLHCAKARGMKLDFYFPDGAQTPATATSGNEAVISIVSDRPVVPALLHDLDAVLHDHDCIVHEVEHRSDNKLENNGHFTKLAIRVGCPLGLRLSSLYMGLPSASAAGLQKVAQTHGVVMTARWWDATNRPTGKSLVVFELSNVLCPYDVLDEVMKEAGVDPASVPTADTLWQQNRNKILMLKGKSVTAVQKVLARLELTRGARLVCGALRAMGFRLAILAPTGISEITDHLRRHLGIDYVICQHLEVADGQFTGEYAGEASDIRFRKSDLLKLMAAREGIGFRNVIVVGEFLRGLKASDARLMLETFGPNVLFHASRQKDLAMALFLLGFSGCHVRSLRETYEPDAVHGADSMATFVEASDEQIKSFVVEVSARGREPGQLRRIMSPLLSQGAGLCVSTVRQCGLQDGGMCLGLELRAPAEHADAAIKELLFWCHEEGFQVSLNEKPKLVNPSIESVQRCWQFYSTRHVITLVQKPSISSDTLQVVFGTLSEKAVSIVKIERLSVRELAALQISVNLPAGLEASELARELMQVSQEQGADIAFQRDNVDRWMRRLVVFDMDSTLIQQEVIDELAKLAGVEHEVKTITEAAMRGDLNFFESLKSRVALLKGHNAEHLFQAVKENLVFTPGAELLCSVLKTLGYKMAVISGGFLPVAERVKQHLGLDYAFANTLEVDEHSGLLTGRTCGPVVTPQRKRALLAMIANVEGCQVQQTIAVGDGANDIPMLSTAGLGIAFCAKPKVQAMAEFRINQKDLSTVLYLIGLSEHATARLAAGADSGALDGA